MVAMNNLLDAIKSQQVPTLDKALTVLVVDDFEAMRRATVTQLTQLGVENIFTAKDGQDALRLLKSQPVNIVLSDWDMPIMSGLELLRAIRSDVNLFTLPFIMIAAEVEQPGIEEAIASGVTSMLIKPYAPAQLMTRVEKALSWKPRQIRLARAAVQTRSSGGAAVGLDISKHPQRPTILVIDDTPDNLFLLSELLKDEYLIRLAVGIS